MWVRLYSGDEDFNYTWFIYISRSRWACRTGGLAVQIESETRCSLSRYFRLFCRLLSHDHLRWQKFPQKNSHEFIPVLIREACSGTKIFTRIPNCHEANHRLHLFSAHTAATCFGMQQSKGGEMARYKNPQLWLFLALLLVFHQPHNLSRNNIYSCPSKSTNQRAAFIQPATMFLLMLRVKLIAPGEKRETSTKTCKETMLRGKLRVFVSRISTP